MRFSNPSAEIFVPDARPIEEALGRTTHLAVAAHQDDVEIMAFHGILECFGRKDRGFAAVVVTDGRGSPRDGIYADYTDEEMREIRRREQKKAAVVGEYAALVLLDYASSAVKDPTARGPLEDLKEIFAVAGPKIVYTHNLADKHDTHVAVALRTIQALRELSPERRPERVLGCEVWRDLDWLPDEDKVPLRVDGRDNLAAALLGVFDSQICGGKRYDLATMGRRRAHATYHATHGVDEAAGLTLAMDLTPLVLAPEESIRRYVASYIERFAAEVEGRLRRLGAE
ncbi:MAG: PIG-L deacetylase family protein [Bacillota bacterium]